MSHRTERQERIYRAVADMPVDAWQSYEEQLAAFTGVAIAPLRSELMLLEMRAEVYHVPGGQYMIAGGR